MSGELNFARVDDGCRIAWRLDGPPGAPVLVFANSLGTTHAMWEPQMAAFTRAWRVLRYDARGHGASDSPLGAYGIDRLARDVVEVLDAAGVASVTFCGLSMGGMVGQRLAITAPERLDALVLANTSAWMGPAGWQERIAAVGEHGMAAVTEGVIERWFTSGFRAANPAAVARVRDMMLTTSPVGYGGCCAALRDMDQRVTAPLIRAPTLVIAGARDPATPPDHARFLADAVPDAAYVELQAAHLSNIEGDAAFNRVVCAFLDLVAPHR